MESDLLSLDFAIFHIDLVAYQADWDNIANTSEILVPLGDILIGDSRGDIEHDDAACRLDAAPRRGSQDRR